MLFFGVLYHVKHPLLALEHVCGLTHDLACIESYVIDHGDLDAKPLMEFCEGEELCGQFDNWVGLNCSCVMAMARTVGFANVELLNVTDQRAHFNARRQLQIAEFKSTYFHIVSFENASTHDDVFSAYLDEYISVWFEAAKPLGPREELVLRMGDFDCVAATLPPKGISGWQANFRFPPGLMRSISGVGLFWGGIVSDNSIDIAVGVQRARSPFVIEEPSIHVIADGTSWERDLIRLGSNTCLSIWARGVVAVLLDQIWVELEGRLFPPIYVYKPDGDGLCQINVMIPEGFEPGLATIALISENRRSAPKLLNLLNL